jgi:hypothetical protein
MLSWFLTLFSTREGGGGSAASAAVAAGVVIRVVMHASCVVDTVVLGV